MTPTPTSSPRSIPSSAPLGGWLAWLLLAVVLLAPAAPALARVAPWDIEKLPSTPAPAFKLTDLGGQVFSSAAFAGRALLINFWAPWCEPCRKEMPALNAVARRFQDRGLTVIGVAVDNGQSELSKRFVAKTSPQFLILHDPELKMNDAFKVFAYPTTFLVDRQGKIRRYWIGAQDWDGRELRKVIEEALN